MSVRTCTAHAADGSLLGVVSGRAPRRLRLRRFECRGHLRPACFHWPHSKVCAYSSPAAAPSPATNALDDRGRPFLFGTSIPVHIDRQGAADDRRPMTAGNFRRPGNGRSFVPGSARLRRISTPATISTNSRAAASYSSRCPRTVLNGPARRSQPPPPTAAAQLQLGGVGACAGTTRSTVCRSGSRNSCADTWRRAPVAVQMWQRRAQSLAHMWRGAPIPGADVAEVSPVAVQVDQGKAGALFRSCQVAPLAIQVVLSGTTCALRRFSAGGVCAISKRG